MMGSVGATESIIFNPTRTDDVTEKLSKAYDLKASATTVTMKDENGKTMGMVRGLRQANKLSGASLFDINSKFTKLTDGVRLTQLSDYGLDMSKVFIDGNKIYILNDVKSDYMFEGRKITKDSPFYRDVEKRKKKNEFLTNFENNGGYVINYRRKK